MANEPIRSMKNQMYNYGIGRAFADNRPVTRGQMARAAIPESTSLIDDIKRLQMAGGLSGRNQLVENKAYTLPAFSLPNDIFSATEEVISTAKGARVPDDFVPFVVPTEGQEGVGIVRGGPESKIDKTIADGKTFSTDEIYSSGRQGNLGTRVMPSDLAGGRGDLIESLTERADYISEESRKKQEKSFDQPQSDKGDPVTNAFMAGMDEFIKSARDAKSPDATKVRDLDDYKREFADATGLDISGKVDKSQALMAFGLALMQNRAGKGFNVGKMLREVGKAGEKAMPELEAARQEARANAAAAGKYALDMRSADQEKAISAAMAAQQRGKYYIMPKSEGISGFLSVMDEGVAEFLNATELNALVTNPEFSEQYDIITEERFATLADAALNSEEAAELYSTTKSDMVLFPGDNVDAIFTFKVNDVNPNLPEDKTPKFGKLSNPGQADQIYDALGNALQDLNKFETTFAGAIADIDEGGATLQAQAQNVLIQALNRIGVDVDANTPTQDLKRFVTKLQAQNAAEILGEAGKTLSDKDRQLVAEIVGDLPGLLGGSPDDLRKKLLQLKTEIVDKKRRQILSAVKTLDNHSRNNYHSLFTDGDFSEEDEKELLRLREEQGVKA